MNDGQLAAIMSELKVAETEFPAFKKIPRLNREIIITEKIDGTNALVHITDDGHMLFGSRKRWITPKDDNFGFAAWATEHRDELMQLGPGTHHGEWWGRGIQRGYGLSERRFSLFNVSRWSSELRPGTASSDVNALRESGPPSCCHVVPVLYAGMHLSEWSFYLQKLERDGSYAAPGFMRPEGIVIFHTAANALFKVTCEDDDKSKGNSDG